MTMTTRQYRLTPGTTGLALQQDTRQLPLLAEDQILIRIGAVSLNYRDRLVQQDAATTRSGLVPLSDAAGTVVAVGRHVSQWREGDRVSPGFFAAWQDGPFKPHHLASALGGGSNDGVLSDYVIAQADAVVAVPDHLSLAEAAALPCAGVTAWHALFERGQLQAGETVLVQGTGGVAMMALQLASAHGARVIVTSSSTAKLRRAEALGAWATINYREEADWDKAVLDLTEGVGADHILELGGPATYTRSLNAVAHGGRIAQIGVLSGFDAAPHITPMQFKNASINGICVGSLAHHVRLNQFMTQHGIHPIIEHQFAFDEAPQAYSALAEANHMGKLVVTLD
ncbi:NAD(P)-dependent alcohol dehydrogenase [Chitinimonas sp. BJYL2]|uniref:zinc-dependent alcohol dehydrogenase family protein n=1 Tax=Chitinimonas sp. BJYL2 TaxID=2976696 RepID=UPI0022B4CDD9|nr:NAD(P)-dependent alcohol dehydrogenase [Chitinimonas sp. BJYL2]